MKTKQIILIALISGLFIGCSPSKDQLIQKISELENTTEVNAEQRTELVNTYLEYIDRFPQDSISRPYLFRSIEVLEELENYEELLKRCDQFSETHKDTYEANLLIYTKARGLHKLGRYGESIDEMKRFIDKKSRLTSDELSFLGVVYQDFIQHNPNDSLTPKYQLGLGNTMSSLGNKSGAAEQFTLYYNTYPKSNGAPYAMMQAADITQKHLNDTASARIILEKLAKKYPDHPFGLEAATILNRGYLGLSDADIYKDFLRRNKDL
jgi:tetratricopeptide (TPR) repeat protein